MDDFRISPGSYVSPLLTWMNVHLHVVFSGISAFFDGLVSSIVEVLSYPPAPALMAIFAVIALLLAGWRCGVLVVAGLLVCVIFGMWEETLQTMVLVLIAVTFSIAVGIPIGVFVSRSRKLQMLARPVLDVMQTLPPWVYLVPAVILFGLGSVPALLSTIIYGLAPMVRLTVLALEQVPSERIELGAAIGASRFTVLRKIEIPSALPTLLVGVNQCILLSLAMVVLAGLVGAGGLGAEVTRGLTRMELGVAMRAGLSIVALAIMMDRVCRNAVPKAYLEVS